MAMAAASAEPFQTAEQFQEDSAWSAWCRSIDHGTLFACMLLFGVGVVLAFASTPALALKNDLSTFYYAWRQLYFGAPAFAVLFLLSFLGSSGVRRVGVAAFVIGLALLIAVPFVGVGHGKAAIRWLSIYGVSFQPTEILKPGLVVFSAMTLTTLRHEDRSIAFGGLLASLLALAASIGLLSIQPDFGQSALILAVWCALYFAAGGSALILTGIGILALIGGSAAYAVAPHFATRINNFLDREGSAQTQIDSAETAILNGGWFGRGLGQGLEKQNLPDAHADFVLAVAAEEFGFVMVAFVIALFMAIFLRAIWRLWSSEDDFARLAGLGLALLIGLQAMINILVSARLAPITGMTLPFVSYGGTSLCASGAAMGMLLALTRRRPRDFSRLFDRAPGRL